MKCVLHAVWMDATLMIAKTEMVKVLGVQRFVWVNQLVCASRTMHEKRQKANVSPWTVHVNQRLRQIHQVS